jgi:hypothetical protein
MDQLPCLAAPLPRSKQPDLHLTLTLPPPSLFNLQPTSTHNQSISYKSVNHESEIKRDKMAEDDRTAVIDETPISPVRESSHVRQNSLEKHLQHRPDPKELRDRHILLDTNAAP